MGKYVFVYYGVEPTNDTPMEEVKAGWMAWFQELGSKLTDGGNPFNTGGKAVEHSGVTTIENFPATGYSIVEAVSMDEATEIAKGCPMLAANPTGAVRVYEALSM
jgi:hypothetical protein